MEIRTQADRPIEVHKFYGGAIFGAAALALLLQTFLPRKLPGADLLDLPLLVTLYFGLSRRNPSTGLLLGMVIGLLQDSLSHVPIGQFGIAKTLVGFAASSIGSRIDLEHPLSRFILAFVFFYFQLTVLVVTRRLLLAQPEPFFTLNLLLAALVNAILAVGLFALLDRLRKS